MQIGNAKHFEDL